MPHHIELVTSGKVETLLQVGMTPSTWHGLARGQRLKGELKVSVTSAGVKQRGQGAAGSTRKEWR